MTENKKLVDLASSARKTAYAPYSHFSVGAAVRTDSGEMFAGCNVENLSFGLTMCAERVAIGAAVAAGHREITEIAIVTDTTEPVVPCGACRQVMAEFNPDLRVISATTSGETSVMNLTELLPLPTRGILNRG